MTRAGLQRPPAVDSTVEARTRDVPCLLWWSQRGYWYGVRHGGVRGRLLSLFIAITWWPALPVAVALQAHLVARPHARYYLSPERDAVIAVVATREGWHIEDHIAARPGTGQGAALRALVLPRLLDHADAEQITIHTTAANETLAARYAAELPGLRDVGRGRPRGRRMRRDPAK